MEYAGATAAAETVHIVSEDENYRLLGAQGFIFFPTLAWQVALYVAVICMAVNKPAVLG